MSRTWVGVIAFAAGVGAGLLIAKLYARSQVTSAVDAGLEKLGLGGGAVQGFVDQYIVPAVV
jgi:hypothetical protein